MSVHGPAADLLVAGAGFVAGAVNAVAGGGTLLTFPVLLATGQSALSANITSSVGLLAGYSGGSVAYRRELRGQRNRLSRLLIPAVAGGVVGAVLLLVTPAHSFRAVVPYLVLFACALLVAQPWLARRVAERSSERAHEVGPGLMLIVFLGGIYGSYFGAVLGVVLLALLAVVLADGLQRVNALKGVLSLVINAAGVVVFLISARVAWAHAGLLALGAVAGATVGVRLARRLPPEVLRLAVTVIGVAVAVTLLVRD